MENVEFCYKVVNWDFNKKCVEYYNIFNNIHVHEETNKLVRKYLRKGLTKEQFIEELDKTIQWQEWSRVEYEISVGYPFEEDCNNLQKIDCYAQAHENIEIIADYVIETYKKAIKKERKLVKND